MERIKNYENEAGRAKKVEAELQKRIEALEEEKKHSINENFLGGTRTRQTSHAQSSSAEDIVAIKREYEGKIYQLEQQNNQVLLELKTAKDEVWWWWSKSGRKEFDY